MTFMDCLGWVVAGAFVGWLPGFILRGQRTRDVVLDLAAGITGGIVGGTLIYLLEFAGEGQAIPANSVGLLASFPCAVIALSLSRQFRNDEIPVGRRRRRRLYG